MEREAEFEKIKIRGSDRSWEYAVKRIDTDREPQELADTLNVLGQDGWELVHVESVTGVHAVAFFKRPR